MTGRWDEEPKRRTLPARTQRVADELQQRATELRETSDEELSIREAVALAAVQLGLAPDANAEAHQDATFWDSVKKIPRGCWEWQGVRTPAGYGRFSVEGKTVAAHRYAYESRIGLIPPRLVIDHLCRNPPCVRPDHLEPVTILQNNARGDLPWAKAARGDVELPETEAPDNSPTGNDLQSAATDTALSHLAEVLYANGASVIGRCDASTVGVQGALLGPCVLRHQHNGPVHQDATGARWADPGGTP